AAADIAGAGFGIAGYDWPSETPQMRATIDRLGLAASYRLVNDALLGLIAGSEAGWGIGLVSGTGCNCWGLDTSGQRLGRVTGYGSEMGEAAGASDLVLRAMQMVNYAWIRRIPPTALTEAFVELAGARGADDLLEGYTKGYYPIGPEAAPLVFRVAEAGDAVAQGVVRWAGCELGEMVNAVARQLNFLELAFDVVLVGSMFSAGRALLDPLRVTVLPVCPGARFVRLNAAPAAGGVLIGMEQGGLTVDANIRSRLIKRR
ncbi:MAG TPA: hypothetical protein VFF68_06940, partial [Anaerolineaceae bacterium]|nr:hypothetical protein [Anaerolineaceae bacterium]